jgi:hypothetical protein
MESRVRILLIESGLPAPEPQVEIEDSDGLFVAGADLAYRQIKLAITRTRSWQRSGPRSACAEGSRVARMSPISAAERPQSR